MRYLFFFAHPDDETVACASTIRQLIENKDEVILVTATDGSAGEVHERAKKNFEKAGSVGKLRRKELLEVAKLLKITEVKILDFVDGEITNQQVWGKLTVTFVDLIDQYKPDVVVTFDHSGWYFHLDHVGVSIAATLAYHQAKHKPDALFHSSMQVQVAKWSYAFPKDLPITHVVDASAHREMKRQALDLHASQNTDAIHQKILSEEKHEEIYQLVFATKEGEKIFADHSIFKKV